MWTLWIAAAIAADPVLFDVGPAASPVLEGFERLTVGSTGRARYVVPPSRMGDAGDPDPLSGDYAVGGTIDLDLPDGTWDLYVQQGTPAEDPSAFAGANFGLRIDGHPNLVTVLPHTWRAFAASPLYAANPRPHFRAEDTPFDRQIAPATPWRRHTLDVQGTVRLHPFGRPLQALVAWPTDDRAGAEIALTLIDAKREHWWTRFIAGPDVAHRALPPLDDLPLGATLTTPSGAPASHTLRLALGDRVARVLTLHGSDGCGTATLRTDDLPPGVHATLRSATWLDAAGHPDKALKPRPVLLTPGEAWTCEQGVPITLVVVVRTDKDATAGTFDLGVRLRRDGLEQEVPLTVEVDAIALDEAMPMGLFAQVPPAVILREGPDSPEVARITRAQLDLFAEAGLDALSLRYTLWPNRWPKPDEPVPSSLLFDAAQHWQQLGGRTFIWADAKSGLRPAAYVRDGDVLPPANAQVARTLIRAGLHAPMPVWFHMWEEEAGWKRLDAVPRGRAFAAELRALQPEPITLLATLATPGDWPVSDAFDVVMVTGDGLLLHQAVEATQDRSTQVWAYNLGAGSDAPLQAWAASADGLLQWHADPFVQDPFHDVHRKRRWFHTMLGTDGEPHGTMQLESLAEGVALVRLLTTLLAKAPTLSRRDDAEALTVLTAMMMAPFDGQPSATYDGRRLDPATLEHVRNTSLRLLKRVPK